MKLYATLTALLAVSPASREADPVPPRVSVQISETLFDIDASNRQTLLGLQCDSEVLTTGQVRDAGSVAPWMAAGRCVRDAQVVVSATFASDPDRCSGDEDGVVCQ